MSVQAILEKTPEGQQSRDPESNNAQPGIQESEAVEILENDIDDPGNDPAETPRCRLLTDNDSEGITIFWGWRHENFHKGIIYSLALAGGWFGLVWWIRHDHSSDTNFVFVLGWLLSLGTIFARNHLAVFLASCLVAPLVIIHSSYAFFIAPFLVITTYRFEGDEFGPQNCSLCSKCQWLVARSPLLIGTPWILARSHKIYSFHNTDDLDMSAETCHLCSILWHSIHRASQSQPLPVIKHPQPVAFITNSEKVICAPEKKATNMGLDEKASPTSTHYNLSYLKRLLKGERAINKTLRVKVWMECFCLRKPVVRMQICGDSISASTILKVETTTASDNPASHKCFNSQRTDSQDIVEWANALIGQCCEQHELCRSQFVADDSKGYLPTRLLDVGGYKNGIISLVTTKDLPAQAIEYFALSHCWGGAIDVKLRKDNLKEMAIIDVTTLPSNFQDAISVTQRLGVRYLWIDSLCIVQDDGQEWEIQSTNMGLVYANAKCVISATASKNSTGGCFRSRDLFRSNCILRQNGIRQLVLRSEEQQNLPKLFNEKIEHAPLTKRGWTFQERYLASRILHFTSGSVLFECNKLMASDHDNGQIGQEYSVRQVIRFDGKLHPTANCALALEQVPQTVTVYKTEMYFSKDGGGYREVPHQVPNYSYAAQQNTINDLICASARLGMRGTFDFLWQFSGTDLAEAAEFHSSWYEMIECYSARSLTRPEDNLMAISGVAYFIQKNTNLKYNSGLWNQNMAFNLLWTVLGKPESKPSRPVPTWSWASVDGKISHRLKEAVPPAKNQFRSSWKVIVSHLPKDVGMIVKDTVNGLVLNSKLKLTCNLWSFSAVKVNVIWDILTPFVDSLFILPVISFQNPEVHPLKSEIQLHGIVLHEKLEDTFERVGYFWTTDKKVVDEFSGNNSQDFRRRAIELV